MKSRLKTYRSLRKKQRLRYLALGSALTLPLFYCAAGAATSNPGTFAWFTSETSAEGSLQNAVTSDLISISDNISYGDNCSVESSITIENISEVRIPLSVNNHTSTLKPGDSTTVSISNPEGQCSIDSFVYKIKGFNNSFIDEIYTVQVNQTILESTMIKEEPPAKAGPPAKGEKPKPVPPPAEGSPKPETPPPGSEPPAPGNPNPPEETPPGNGDTAPPADSNPGNGAPPVEEVQPPEGSGSVPEDPPSSGDPPTPPSEQNPGTKEETPPEGNNP